MERARGDAKKKEKKKKMPEKKRVGKKKNLPSRSLPSHFLKGSSSCSLLELGSTATEAASGDAAGAWYVSIPGSKPLAGSSSPTGGESEISLPSAPTSVSTSGLNERSPAMA